MEYIINLTQHPATKEQRDAGVIDLPPEEQKVLRGWLTFDDLPSRQVIRERAYQVAYLAAKEVRRREPDGGEGTINNPEITRCMIGGAPYLMGPLEKAVNGMQFGGGALRAVYAFSAREGEKDIVQKDGSVKKVVIFRHLGFVDE